jgi:hypothetical protein
MRLAKTPKPMAGKAEKAPKAAPMAEQLTLDFEGRAPAKAKAAAKAGATTVSRRQAGPMGLDIPVQPKR